MGGVVAAAVASGAAVVVLMCLFSFRPAAGKHAAEEVKLEEDARTGRRRRIPDAWPAVPPEAFSAAVAVAARTVGFAWSETLGKWAVGDIVFGIKRYMNIQGNLQHEYAGSKSTELKGHAFLDDLIYLLEQLKLCMYFSKRRFQEFLNYGGFSNDNVLLHKSQSRLLKPKFTLICDEKSECFLILIRGAISTKDRLTAATSAEVPFHHIVLQKGSIKQVVLGYAHCGMVAAARWIAKNVIPCLRDAMHRYPNFKIQIIGHSMGAGVGSILTYILREQLEFSSCSCIAYAPAACMTWELAESGKDFVTSLVNRTDVVPAFSKVSVENLHAEVMLSSHHNDDRNCLARLSGALNMQMASIQSHIPFMSRTRTNAKDPVIWPTNNHLNGSIHEPLLMDAGEATRSAANGGSAHHNRQVLQAHGLGVAYAANLRKNVAVKCPVTPCKDSVTTCNGISPSSEADVRISIPCSNGAESSKSARPHQFYPPGRIIHMVALPREPVPGEASMSSGETVSVFETSRDLYSKIRLTPYMIKEHYMPSYIATMESLITQLQSTVPNR